MTSLLITSELKDRIPLFENFEVGEKVPLTRPFLEDIINGTLDLLTMKTSDLEEACISCGYLGLNSKFIVDELIWRDGGEKNSSYFSDNKVSITNIALRNEFLQYYGGEVSLITQCRRKYIGLSCHKIAEEGNLRLLKYACEIGCLLDHNVCADAAENGHLECLKYLHERGCTWGWTTCASAAARGHLECLKYAHENGCDWNSSVCYNSAAFGHLECLKYAHENGCPWGGDVCIVATQNGELECLKYALENKCPWINKICKSSDYCDKLDCLKYEREGWNAFDKCIYAAKNGHLDCLKYAHENGYM